jgi:hypothetical protein
MSCICCSTAPVSYFAVTRSWGSTPDGSRLVLCDNCGGLISRVETSAVYKLRRREAQAACAPVPLPESPWVFPDDAAITTLATELISSTR